MRANSLLCAVLLLGCGDKDSDTDDTFDPGDTGDSGDTGDTGDPGDLSLAALDFLLTSAEGFEPVATVSVSFSDSYMSLGTGCNTFGAAYTIDGATLVLGDGEITEMGCEEDLTAQQDWLVAFFSNEPDLAHAAPTLTVGSADATLVFTDREVALPDEDLVGNTWTVDTFIEGESASSYGTANAPTLVFREDGTVMMTTGCNTGSAAYSATATELTLSGAGWTEMDCEDGVDAEIEAHVQAIMADGTVSYEIDESRLVIMRGPNGIMARTE